MGGGEVNDECVGKSLSATRIKLERETWMFRNIYIYIYIKQQFQQATGRNTISHFYIFTIKQGWQGNLISTRSKSISALC